MRRKKGEMSVWRAERKATTVETRDALIGGCRQVVEGPADEIIVPGAGLAAVEDVGDGVGRFLGKLAACVKLGGRCGSSEIIRALNECLGLVFGKWQLVKVGTLAFLGEFAFRFELDVDVVEVLSEIDGGVAAVGTVAMMVAEVCLVNAF